MRFFLHRLLAIGLIALSGCNLPSRQPTAISLEPNLVVTPPSEATLTLEPLVTETQPPTSTSSPTAEPTPTETLLLTPTPGLQPGLQASALRAGEAVMVTAVDMLDMQTGWGEWAAAQDGISGNFLRTQDGGKTWQDVTPPSGYPAGSRFFALDGQHAWASPAEFITGESVDSGFVWRTVDGGTTWLASEPIHPQLSETALLESFYPQALFFLDELRGWLVVAVGHYMNQDVLAILATSDGGLTWQQLTDKFSMGQAEGQTDAAGMPCRVNGIVFTDPQNGFLAGDCLDVSMDMGFSILVTQDGGRTWQSQLLPDPPQQPQALLNAAAENQRFCAPTAVEKTPGGILVQHTCQMWEGSGMLKNYFFLSLLPGDGGYWRSWIGEVASFATQNDGYTLGPLMQNGRRSLFVTADGGITWQERDVVSWPSAWLDFPLPERGFALAWQWDENRQAYDYALVRTENGGMRWDLIEGVLK